MSFVLIKRKTSGYNIFPGREKVFLHRLPRTEPLFALSSYTLEEIPALHAALTKFLAEEHANSN